MGCGTVSYGRQGRQAGRSSPSILEDDDEHDVVDEVEAQVHRHEKRRCLAVVRRNAHPKGQPRSKKRRRGTTASAVGQRARIHQVQRNRVPTLTDSQTTNLVCIYEYGLRGTRHGRPTLSELCPVFEQQGVPCYQTPDDTPRPGESSTQRTTIPSTKRYHSKLDRRIATTRCAELIRIPLIAHSPCRHLNHVGKVAVVPHEAQHAFVRVARQLLRSKHKHRHNHRQMTRVSANKRHQARHFSIVRQRLKLK